MSSLPSPRFNRDTGFPEPFNGERNTTLPYPGAQVGPNATLGSSETDHSLFEMRTRRSFQSQMKRIGTFRNNRHSTRLSNSFSIDSAIVTAVSPGTAHYVSSPTTAASPSSTASSSVGSVAGPSMPTAVGMSSGNSSTPSLNADHPRASIASSLDLCQLAALANGEGEREHGEDRPMSANSSSSSGSKRRAFGRLFGRGRKNSL